MWVKWKYNDHGWPDWRELEIPDSAMQEYDSTHVCVVNYLIDNCRIPTWSERYTVRRIKWSKIEKTKDQLKEFNKAKILQKKNQIAWLKKEIKELEKA
jgi:hypothetical protein